MNPSPITVSTLLCHQDVEMGMRCLKALTDCSDVPIEFTIHDDGSLTPDDRERIVNPLRSSGIVGKIILRSEADQQVEAALAGHPRCSALRKRQVFGLKLFDIPLLSADPVVRYIDSDVLFLKRVSGLFELEDRQDCIFMQDNQNAYAMRPWHMLDRKLRLPQKVNSGLFVIRRKLVSLDEIEWLLAKDLPVFYGPPWFEQTCWAWLAEKHNGYVWDDAQVKVVETHTILDDKLIAAHFVSPVRGRINEIEPLANLSAEPPVPAIKLAMKRLNSAAYMFETVKRSIRNRLF